MQLLKFELQKLFLNKKTIILLLCIIFIPVFINAYDGISFQKDTGKSSKLYNMFKPYEGPIDAAMEKKAIAEMEKYTKIRREDPSKYDSLDKSYIYFYKSYANASSDNANYYKGYGKDPLGLGNIEAIYSLKALEEKLNDLKATGKLNTYEYANTQKQYEMSVNSGAPEFYYNITWASLFGYIDGGGSFMFIAFFILLTLSPVFSNEYSSGMDSLILSSKKGRRKIVTTKLIASALFAIVFTVIYNLIQLALFVLVYGKVNWDAPLKSIWTYSLTPYDMNMLQHFFIQLGLQVIGCTMLALMAVMISSLFRSSLVAFFTGFIIVFYPLFVSGLLKLLGSWTRPFIDISIINVISTYPLFKIYKAYNIFGNPVLYPFAATASIIILGFLAVICTYWRFSKREVC